MTAGIALAAAVGLPLAGALAGAWPPARHRAGRIVTSALGLATVAAGAVLGLTAAASDGDVGGVVLRADRAMALLLVVVLGTATVVSSFASRSLDHDDRTPAFFAGIATLATGSAAVMTAATPLVLVAGWITSGWALAWLVGFDRSGRGVARARRRIVRSLAVGDVALVLGLVVASVHADELLTNGPEAADQLRATDLWGIPSVHVVALLLVVAGASRSALLPFHRWLVGTLVAPTPVSAVVHAGFVSGAGILLVRLAPSFVASTPAVVVAMAAATVTVVLGSAVSAARPDVKGSLAWSTVAQMAFMVVQCAVGAFSSAVVHIGGHGMYKAARFLGAGDTISQAVRARRRPTDGPLVPTMAGRVVTLVVPAAAVALGFWWFPPLVNDAGRVLIAVFAWTSIVAALAGWLRRHPFGPIATVATGSLAAVALAVAYLGGLRAVEGFLKPVLGSPATAVGPAPVVVIVLAAGALMAAPHLPGHRGERVREVVDRWRLRWSLDLVRPATPPIERGPVPQTAVDDAERARIRSDVAAAAALVAPMWPLSSFVAVNPLGGMEQLGFEQAAVTARRWLRARTHLPLAEYRADHERGLTRLADLEYVVHQRCAELCARPALEVEGRRVDPVDVIVADLLHGPEVAETPVPRTVLERRGDEQAGAVIDELVAEWAAVHVGGTDRSERFVTRCRRLAANDPRVRAITSPSARRWLAALDDDPAAVVAAALSIAGIAPEARIDEARGHLARLAGWSGLAKWRNDWAPHDDPRPPLVPIEIVAVRAALEAAVLHSTPAAAAPAADDDDLVDDLIDDGLDERVRAVAEVLAPRGKERDLEVIRGVLAGVHPADRASMWLDAQERCFDERLLTVLDRVDPGRRIGRPETQAVFCIDVRSEGLRRHLEELGDVETFGFAGFFGVPLSVRRIGWEHDEARCPVLVAPSVPATEHADPAAIGTVARQLQAERRRAGLLAAHDGAKHAPGGPFALAESVGWISGPAAAIRTLLPTRVRRPEPRSTRMLLDDSVLVDQRVFAAESVLRTMGLVERFAPLVLLCGHTSRTVNNAHASALDCGACGGAAGDDNAMAVAALLNAPDVRHGLAERGIEIPDDTWFAAGVHDTASDHVTILDAGSAPPSHLEHVRRLQDRLDRAGAAQAAARARHLPGPSARVRDRGVDWAQVRPEWGLARAAAFVIGPRSLTSGIDLDGRTFLHGYDPEHDPTGRVLETIMTAPLVVAHWIASQYYFSTVDPEVFGAGDKLVHNPIGSVGVVSGEGGDLRVGLPLQSTHVDGRRHHQPVRLLAVVQADLARIEEIIGRHRILQTLVAGSWLRIAARSHPHEPWSTRTAAGTWITNPRPFEAETTIAQDSPIAHAEMT